MFSSLRYGASAGSANTENVTENTPKSPNTFAPPNTTNAPLNTLNSPPNTQNTLNNFVQNQHNTNLIEIVNQLDDVSAFSASAIAERAPNLKAYNKLLKEISKNFMYLNDNGSPCPALPMNASKEVKTEYLRRIIKADALLDGNGRDLTISVARNEVLTIFKNYMIEHNIEPTALALYTNTQTEVMTEASTEQLHRTQVFENDDVLQSSTLANYNKHPMSKNRTITQHSPAPPARSYIPKHHPFDRQQQGQISPVRKLPDLNQNQTTLEKNIAFMMNQLSVLPNMELKLNDLVEVKKQVGRNSVEVADNRAQIVANKHEIDELKLKNQMSSSSSPALNQSSKSIEKIRLKRKIQMREYFVRRETLTRNGTLQIKVYRDGPPKFIQTDSLDMDKFHAVPKEILPKLGIIADNICAYASFTGDKTNGLENKGRPAGFKIDVNFKGVELRARNNLNVDFASHLIENRRKVENIAVARTIHFIDAAAQDTFNIWKYDKKVINHWIVNRSGKYTIHFAELGKPADFVNVRHPLNLATLTEVTRINIIEANAADKWVYRGEVVTIGAMNATHGAQQNNLRN